MIPLKLAIAGIGVASALTFVGYQQYTIHSQKQENIALVANTALLKAGVDQQDQTIDFLNDGISELIASNEQLNARVRAADAKASAEAIRLNSFRGGRLSNAAKKKPKLVIDRANRAIDDLMRQFAAETGNNQ